MKRYMLLALMLSGLLNGAAADKQTPALYSDASTSGWFSEPLEHLPPASKAHVANTSAPLPKSHLAHKYGAKAGQTANAKRSHSVSVSSVTETPIAAQKPDFLRPVFEDLSKTISHTQDLEIRIQYICFQAEVAAQIHQQVDPSYNPKPINYYRYCTPCHRRTAPTQDVTINGKTVS